MLSKPISFTFIINVEIRSSEKSEGLTDRVSLPQIGDDLPDETIEKTLY